MPCRSHTLRLKSGWQHLARSFWQSLLLWRIWCSLTCNLGCTHIKFAGQVYDLILRWREPSHIITIPRSTQCKRASDEFPHDYLCYVFDLDFNTPSVSSSFLLPICDVSKSPSVRCMPILFIVLVADTFNSLCFNHCRCKLQAIPYHFLKWLFLLNVV